MGIIFLFSSYDAQTSSIQSQLVVDFINKYVPTNSFYIRKLAHFSLFFILEMILYTGLKICMVKNPGLYSILSVSIYAISDEIHQYFVPGRSCELRDMIIENMPKSCFFHDWWTYMICSGMGNVVYDDYYRHTSNASAYISVRVPQENYDAFINSIEDKDGNIVVCNIVGNDLTAVDSNNRTGCSGTSYITCIQTVFNCCFCCNSGSVRN